MPKKLNEPEGIGQRIVFWNKAGTDDDGVKFVPTLCIVCRQYKLINRSTALVWRSNKDAPACCARTAPHLVARIQKLEQAVAGAVQYMEAGDLFEAKVLLDTALNSQGNSGGKTAFLLAKNKV